MARRSIRQQLWHIFDGSDVFRHLISKQIVIVLTHLLTGLFLLGSLDGLCVEAAGHCRELSLIISGHSAVIRIRIMLACHAIDEAWRRAVPVIAPGAVAD